ncbi:hypothetical protein LTR92_009254 [Exophiala xenobiotica]|nr:hypothetical protein LTR92_009254 [Exophiala xenobiotica]
MSVRVINVTDLMILGREGSHPHALSHRDFDILFTPHREIHFNYHGYANELQGLLFGRPNLERVSISSFQNELSSTTPFETMLKNNCSQYHVAEATISGTNVPRFSKPWHRHRQPDGDQDWTTHDKSFHLPKDMFME